MEFTSRIVSSALWAAYGDALGFITELADDERSVRHRLAGGTFPVTTTRAWRRNIGGRFGVQVPLPAGCYSDDTQLRLATCRSIRGSREFDIEAFAKVELPVWLTYQLGGGRGTKAAATALCRRSVSWMGNFYEKPTRYIDAGGNGAAMRIQPHVWSASDTTDPHSFLGDVLKNSIVTHGHPRGFVGAALHALMLADTIEHGAVPGPERWRTVLARLKLIPGAVREDEDLSTFWLPHWERTTSWSLDQAVDEVVQECQVDLNVLGEAAASPQWNYADVVARIGGFSPEHRGSGTKSVLLSLALAWQLRDEPGVALSVAANCLTSDTDSIASLAGALLGLIHPKAPPGEVADAQYIATEAIRIAESRTVKRESFQYPNLTKWVAPLSATAVVGLTDSGRIAVAGLGFAEPIGEAISARSKAQGQWQWLELEFGQRVLARIREPLPRLKPSSLPMHAHLTRRVAPVTQPGSGPRALERQPVLELRSDPNPSGPKRETPLSLDAATDQVVASGFAPQLIGELLLDFARRADGVELAVAFAAVVAKARIARLKRGSGNQPPAHHRNPPPPHPNPEVAETTVTQEALPLD